MEDGDINHAEFPATLNAEENKKVLGSMANYPDVEVAVIKNKNVTDVKNSENSKVNGESEKKEKCEQEESSDEDILVIDEGQKNQRKTKKIINRKRSLSSSPDVDFKGFKKRIITQSSESVNTNDLDSVPAVQGTVTEPSEDKCDGHEESHVEGELDNSIPDEPIGQTNQDDTEIIKKDNVEIQTSCDHNQTVPSEKHIDSVHVIGENKPNEPPKQKFTFTQNKLNVKKSNKKCQNSKLTEYAQYLGLQPTVKFKCCKCSESSFPSLSALNEHQRQCLAQPPVSKPTPPPAPATTSTNFRVTRKVYLCSACGTYYENWNLFLHMREVHRRFICLYCLGMFSLSEKLSQHLVSKHNCVPHRYLSTEDFLSSYKESCFLMCCHCEKVFSERDNFFSHVCTEKASASAEKQCWSCGVKGSAMHNLACKAGIEQAPPKPPGPPATPNSKVPSKAAAKPAQKQIEDSTQLNQIHTEGSLEPVGAAPPPPKQVEDEPAEACVDSDHDGASGKHSEMEDGQNDAVNLLANVNENEVPIKNDASDSIENERLVSDNENSSQEDSDNGDKGEDKSYKDDSINDQDSKHLDNDSSTDQDKYTSADAMSTASEEVEKDEEADEKSDTEARNETEELVEEVRKVPKVTLKLPPQNITNYSDNESDDSEKLTMEVDEAVESDRECDESQDCFKESAEETKAVNGFEDKENSDSECKEMDSFQVAGEEIPVVELTLEQPLDRFAIAKLLKICLLATVQTCVYCNHARKISVNGKHLGLHAIAEHRFSATVNSITAEELIPENFVTRIKESLDELESVYFCIEEKESEPKEDCEPTNNFKRLYECFQCRYITSIHKELYLHNRKMHAKTILLCIMCKSNFYSYSELICHICPGNYVLNSETKFHCCICDVSDLPSAFRLMVHLRKRHHTCDVCLESCHNQSKLSNHVWKHKLHHLCYRCGIAYRNKPDITKHLFWKHGTESVLCKKCLQKKWPHVYHFCVPPNTFLCEECNLSFSKAVYLKVHKRLHSKDRPHACIEENCTETFISKKLLQKHELRHREPVPIEFEEPEEKLHNGDVQKNDCAEEEKSLQNKEYIDDHSRKSKSPEKEEQKQMNLIDAIPALNLSESDSDSDEEETPKPVVPMPVSDEQLAQETAEGTGENTEQVKNSPAQEEETEQKVDTVIDNIWENFKNYQATIEKQNINVDKKEITKEEKSEGTVPTEETTPDINVILADHDYCCMNINDNETSTKENAVENGENRGLDHDYCTVDEKKEVLNTNISQSQLEHTYTPDIPEKKKVKSLKKKTKHDGSSSSSDSSSDSDSSSCTCGSNCSCSSSSGSSSSSSSSSDSDSSSSEGKRRIAQRRERRKEKIKRKKECETSQAASNTSAVDVVVTEDAALFPSPVEVPIQESDLETDETETDEDFYDEHPQRLANKILAEKRNQLMLLTTAAPISNGSILECSRPSTPSIPDEAPAKKKVKSKKRKKKSRSSTPKESIQPLHIPDYHNHQASLLTQPAMPMSPILQQPVAPAIPYHSAPSAHLVEPVGQHNTGSGSETDSNVRSSKRRRVPNKFYGYSSDEENAEKSTVPHMIKWRKSDLPFTPTHVSMPPQYVPPITIKNIPSPAPILEPVRAPVIHHTELPDSDSEPENNQPAKDSSDTSDSNRNDDSDSDTGQLHISQPPEHAPSTLTQSERTNENLYCYCQCPYDEVSEMIACDGKDCAIEWFHFECVGIMVPPKGKWFCPDCRKKSGTRNDFIHS